jgi:hypothetical protein
VGKKLVYAAVVIAILAVGALYVSGYQLYQYPHTLAPASSPNWGTLYLKGSSGETLAELNFTAAFGGGNGTKGVSFGFQLWHAQGFNIKLVNLTFGIGPYPADVWVTGFNYYTDGYAPLSFQNANYSGGSTGVSGAVLTLSGFPSQNPTALYGVGLAYKNAELPADIGSTTVLVQLVLTSTSEIPFVGDTYAGQTGFNLVYLGNSTAS